MIKVPFCAFRKPALTSESVRVLTWFLILSKSMTDVWSEKEGDKRIVREDLRVWSSNCDSDVKIESWLRRGN